jgi:hypothetical protein
MTWLKEQLPDEVIYNIIYFLEVGDVGHISQLCNRFNQVANTPFLWNQLYKRDYLDGECQFETWKESYKRKKIKDHWFRGILSSGIE